MQKVCIIGMGLMGGSLGLAIKKYLPKLTVYGVVRKKSNIDKVMSLGAADQVVMDTREVVCDSDWIILATPPLAIEKTLRDISVYLSKDQLVTDVASVKHPIMSLYRTIISKKAHYIGSHPIAGSERSGIEAASATLFVGSRSILTPEKKTPQSIIAEVAAFWRKLGAQPILMDAKEHDRIFSMVSHLPHLISFALAGCSRKRDSDVQYAGDGWKDMTRIAGSLPGLWSEIAAFNGGNLLRDIRMFRQNLKKIEQALKEKNHNGLRKVLDRFQQRESARDD